MERQIWRWCGFLLDGDDGQQPSAHTVLAYACSEPGTAGRKGWAGNAFVSDLARRFGIWCTWSAELPNAHSRPKIREGEEGREEGASKDGAYETVFGSNLRLQSSASSSSSSPTPPEHEIASFRFYAADELFQFFTDFGQPIRDLVNHCFLIVRVCLLFVLLKVVRFFIMFVAGLHFPTLSPSLFTCASPSPTDPISCLLVRLPTAFILIPAHAILLWPNHPSPPHLTGVILCFYRYML